MKNKVPFRKITGLFLLIIIGIVIYGFYPEDKLPKGTIDKLVVFKSKRELHALSEGKLLKIYTISLGRNPEGDKEYEGDKKTPEGLYFINDKNTNSGYYKNLGISYPNEEDRKHAQTLGKPTGGDIKIHGLRNGMGWIGKLHRRIDWTMGCIALTNTEIEELYQAVAIGTPIEIKP